MGVLPSHCRACGGEVVSTVRLEPPALVEGCAHCGAASSLRLDPAGKAEETLARVLAERARRRAQTAAARPVILIWMPPGEARHGDYRDVGVLVAERLAGDDPSIWLRTEPYPESADEESAVLAALADLSLLVAPCAADARRAVRLVGEAIPTTRALVLATGLSPGEATDLVHPRLRVLDRAENEPGGLFDALSDALTRIRRVAWWRALDPSAPPGDPIAVHETHGAEVAVVNDDLCVFLLRLADRSVPVRPRRLLDEAGGEVAFEVRLRLLREAGALEVVRDRAQLTPKGRALLSRLLPGSAAPGASRPSTLSRLFQDAKSGSQEALGRLLKTGGEQARMVARRRLGPALRAKVDSIDISQSVVVDLMRGMDRFEFRGDPQWRGYLRRLVENKIRAKADYFGAARRDVRRERSLETRGRAEGARTTEPPAASPSPSERILREEEIEKLGDALEMMTPAERDVIILRVFEGLSHREIATRLGRPSENAIHKLYGRALAKLAGLMGGAS